MMRARVTVALSVLLLLGTFPQALPGQQRDTTRAAGSRVLGQPAGQGQRAVSSGQIGTPNYDVVLEVPRLVVDSIGLRVRNLEAHLSLNANAANLVSLTAGADVEIDRVQLELEGVYAEAYVYADLDNVARIVDRVLTTLGQNPQLLTRLLSTVDTAVNTVGNVANTALQPGGVVGQTLQNVTQPGGLLSQTVNSLGQTVQRTVDGAGNIVERTVDGAGNVVGQRGVGNLLNLPVLRQTTNAAGQTVRQVRDGSGGVIEYTLDGAGKIVSSRVVRQARSQRR